MAYQYIYDQAGSPLYKRQEMVTNNAKGRLDARWDYDEEGRMVKEYYPNYGSTTGTIYSYDRDALGRLAGMRIWNGNSPSGSVVSGVTFNAAGQMLAMNYPGYNESRGYNHLNQMTQLMASATIAGAPNVNLDTGTRQRGTRARSVRTRIT